MFLQPKMCPNLLPRGKADSGLCGAPAKPGLSPRSVIHGNEASPSPGSGHQPQVFPPSRWDRGPPTPTRDQSCPAHGAAASLDTPGALACTLGGRGVQDQAPRVQRRQEMNLFGAERSNILANFAGQSGPEVCMLPGLLWLPCNLACATFAVRRKEEVPGLIFKLQICFYFLFIFF